MTHQLSLAAKIYWNTALLIVIYVNDLSGLKEELESCSSTTKA